MTIAQPKWATQSESSAGPSTVRKPGGVWENLGIDSFCARALLQRGFNTPTPIQRSTLPITLSSPPRDVLGMARTGSGKTLAYVLPLLHRLGGKHSPSGARALIICPNRELALQIMTVAKDIARGWQKGQSQDERLRWAIIMGGEGLDAQFEAMTHSPDIIIATPGRLLHVVVEMNLDLRSIDMVIYDEADRLFESGFEVQLTEILHRLPITRQNLLFSATLPSKLAEFAKAGLINPVLIRLDADNKISSDLDIQFLFTKPVEKEAALLVLLAQIVKVPTDSNTGNARVQAIIFVSTKHHVEYIATLAQAMAYRCSRIYGSLDQVARQQQLHSFRAGFTDLLIVTDVAARGLDIPVMDNVVNYDFPSSSRTFVHRVGRTARAGRTGTAWSLVTRDELPYLHDLEIFLARSLTLPESFGRIPQNLVDDKVEFIASGLQETSSSLSSLRQVMLKGQRQYERSRGKASSEAYRKARDFTRSERVTEQGLHHCFRGADDTMASRSALLQTISEYEARETVFELGSHGQVPAALIMKSRRAALSKRSKSNDIKDSARETFRQSEAVSSSLTVSDPQASTFQDSQYFLPHRQKDASIEKGYSIRDNDGFAAKLRSSIMDTALDEGAPVRAQMASQLQWDRKKKRYVAGGGVGADNKKMIRTEGGNLLPATYRSGRYDEWRKSSKSSRHSEASVDITTLDSHVHGRGRLRRAATNGQTLDSTTSYPKMRPANGRSGPASNGRGTELKTSRDVVKSRRGREQRKAKSTRTKRRA